MGQLVINYHRINKKNTNFQKPVIVNSFPYDHPDMHFGLMLIFLEDYLRDWVYFHGVTWLEVCLLYQCSSSHIHKESYRHWTICCNISSLVFMSELLRVCLVLKIVLTLYWFPTHLKFSETPLIYGIYTKPRDFPSFLRWRLPLELVTK
jgi:hypothetical protein